MGRKQIIIVVIVVLVGVIVGTLAYSIGQKTSNNSGVAADNTAGQAAPATQNNIAPPPDKEITKQTFTPEVAGLKLASLVEGDSAKQQIVQLHQVEIPLKEAYVASYKGDKNQEVTIWVSVSDNDAGANDLLNQMDSKMDSSKTFTEHQEAPIGGITYHFVRGMGQAHYFYQRGNDVIWIAIKADSAEEMKLLSPFIKLL